MTDGDGDGYCISNFNVCGDKNLQVGSNHYPECQVFRTLTPRLVVSDFEEEGNVIYQVTSIDWYLILFKIIHKIWLAFTTNITR